MRPRTVWSHQQELLYASNRHAVLLIFQAMDAAGKVGVIQHVMSGVNRKAVRLRGEGLPDTRLNERAIWRDRCRSIVDLERHLQRNGTCIVKFFQHMSKDAQHKRFIERMDDPDKHWTIRAEDIEARRFWKDGMKVCVAEQTRSCGACTPDPGAGLSFTAMPFIHRGAT